MSKRYAIIGDIIAESFQEEILPGGAAAIGLAIRDLGGEVTLRSRLGTDANGDAILTEIRSARIHPKNIDRVDGPTSALVRHEDGSSSHWQPGTLMAKDVVMDIYELFAHNALILDINDQPLRNFLIDLPAHTDGKVRMLTTLSHLDHTAPAANELEFAMRCDTIVGTEEQFAKITGEAVASNALGMIFEQMPLTHLRAAVAITAGGIEIISRDTRVLRPVQDAVPALLLPQVVAGVAWGMANYADWDTTATIALDPSAVE